MKDNLRFSLHPCFFLLPSTHPFPLALDFEYVQQKHKLLKQNRTKEQTSPSERWPRDVLFIFQSNEKLGELSLGGGDLFDMSRVDFLSVPIYWQNEERRNIGFGNKEPITLNKLLFIYSNYD